MPAWHIFQDVLYKDHCNQNCFFSCKKLKKQAKNYFRQCWASAVALVPPLFFWNTAMYLTALLLHFGHTRVVMIFTGRPAMLERVSWVRAGQSQIPHDITELLLYTPAKLVRESPDNWRQDLKRSVFVRSQMQSGWYATWPKAGESVSCSKRNALAAL